MAGKVQVDDYDLEKISSRMAKDFGKMEKGEEEDYSFVLFYMESNMLKRHRQDPERSSLRALEAVRMALLHVNGYFREEEYDFSSVSNPENKSLCDGLRMAFDPFHNKELKEVAASEYELSSESGLQEYFTVPVKCLIRVEDSIQHWTDKWGSSGYFDFLEENMGDEIPRDNEMNFSVKLEANTGGVFPP